MSSASRFLGLGVALGLAAGLLVGVGLAQPGRAAATGPSPAPSVSGPVDLASAPAAFPIATTGGPAMTGSGSGAAVAGTVAGGSPIAGSAIAYPYFTGPAGLAPEGTIVVTGVGQADMKADGSDRAGAQRTALAAALGDAKAQADAIAAVTGLKISGVYSVSSSTSPVYGVMPMTGAANGSGTGQALPPVPQPVYPQTLSVSVTVAYRVG